MKIDNNERYVYVVEGLRQEVDRPPLHIPSERVSGLEMASAPSCEPEEGVKYPVKVEYCPNCGIPFEVEVFILHPFLH